VTSDKQSRQKLPSIFYNGTTVFGVGLAGVALIMILFLMAVEAFSHQDNPYMGIFAFVVLPVFLVLGILLIIGGALRERRRRMHGEQAGRLPRVDLNDTKTRRAATIFTVGAVVFLTLSAFGSFKAYEYSESDAFCGTVCHQVMEPEYTAYQNSPHARVGCVKCHIGEGAEWFVRSKLSGAYQVYAVAANVYPQPIHTPIKNLRPSRDTCEQCHWPEHFFNDKYIIHDYYSSEEDNNHFRLHMLVKIGGGGVDTARAHGIHYHMNVAQSVEYVATDERRQEIPWVRSTLSDGTVRVFRSTESDFTDPVEGRDEVRTMDCIDCHNRPSHRYDNPYDLANQAISQGRVSSKLPGIKAVMVEALEGDYESDEAARAGIEETFRESFEDQPNEAVEQAIAETWRLFNLNYFPYMKTNWKAFPENVGHMHSPGCFRCHDGLHETETGEVITRDCNVCHNIVAQEFDDGSGFVALGGHEYQHPVDIDGAWKEMNCTECHAP
jgi:hypothetical protein